MNSIPYFCNHHLRIIKKHLKLPIIISLILLVLLLLTMMPAPCLVDYFVGRALWLIPSANSSRITPIVNEQVGNSGYVMNEPKQTAEINSFLVPWHPRQARKMRALIGSSPPSCISKCNKCTPCTAVRVSIHPGQKKLGLLEYYPEAWRCKCKNKLYMP